MGLIDPTPEQRSAILTRRYAEYLLSEYPTKSTRMIAEIGGIDFKVVQRVRCRPKRGNCFVPPDNSDTLSKAQDLLDRIIGYDSPSSDSDPQRPKVDWTGLDSWDPMQIK